MLDRRVLLLGEKSSEPNCCEHNFDIILVEHQSEKLLEITELLLGEFNCEIFLTLNCILCAIRMKSCKDICSALNNACSMGKSIRVSSLMSG